MKHLKGRFFKTKKKVKVNLIILMALIMTGNGEMISLMDMVDIIIILQMKVTLEIGKKVKCMDKVNIHFKTLQFIQAIFNKTKCMDMGLFDIKMVVFIKEIG